MANQEQLAILQQGVEQWNRWRKQHRSENIDLSDAILSCADLSSANLRYSDLFGVNLSYANLSSADFSSANLSSSKLSLANLSSADLSNANLSGADLSKANLSTSYLSFANLSSVSVESTVFGDVDLRTVKGLDTVRHLGPSTIGTDTLERSQGEIPEVFLRGAGLSDTFIEYARALVQKPIDYYTCFISYSSKDEMFAKRLYNDLQGEGVRCWFAPEDMKIGDKIRHRIDESIRVYDKLLVVLSYNSLASTWVENEVETAFEKEQQYNKLVLFPIRLDETIMQTNQAWAVTLRRTRHIGTFTHWNDPQDYQNNFARLLRDLKSEA